MFQAAIICLCAVYLTGCSSKKETPGTTGSAAGAPGGASGRTGAGAPGGKSCIEACALLTAEEVSALIGASRQRSARKCATVSYVSECLFQTEDARASATLMLTTEPGGERKYEVWKQVNTATQPTTGLDGVVTTADGQQQLIFRQEGYLYWMIITGKKMWSDAEREHVQQLARTIAERGKTAARIPAE